MKDKQKVQMEIVNALKAATKAITAVYHDGSDETIADYLDDSAKALKAAKSGLCKGKKKD